MWRYVGWQNSIVSRRSLRMDEDSSLHTVFGWANSIAVELRPQHHNTLAMLKLAWWSRPVSLRFKHSVVTLRNMLCCSVRPGSSS